MINREILLAAGYREHQNLSRVEHYDKLFQKCIRGPDGLKLYFVNITEYDHRKYGHNVGYQADNQFTLPDGTVFNVVRLSNDDTVEKIEAFFDHIFRTLGCLPYES